MFEYLLEFAIEAVGALLIGAAVGATIAIITYAVSEKITRWNLSRLAREALQQEREQAAKEAIAKALNNMRVKRVDGNTVVLSVSEFEREVEQEVGEIRITGIGVDTNVHEGMKVYA